METIRNYLDTMFANMPNTPSVLRAREELWQMMEDKYNELIEEGKSENEAVGTVISEFGNLSELAEAIGIEEEVKQQETEVKTEEIPKTIVNVDEAKEYMRAKTDSAFKRSLGVGLIIMSIAGTIISDALLPNELSGLAVLTFFGFVTVGIILLVQSNSLLSKWKTIKSGKFSLSMDATKQVIEDKDNFYKNRSIYMTVGVIMCALCWLPGVLLSELVHSRFVDDFVGVLFFIFVGTGVMLLVYQAQIMEGYSILLRTTRKETIQASYSPQKKQKMVYANTGLECMMSVFWPTVICLYFILSFVCFGWLWTWIIWPIAAVVHAIINRTCLVPAQDSADKEIKKVSEDRKESDKKVSEDRNVSEDQKESDKKVNEDQKVNLIKEIGVDASEDAIENAVTETEEGMA